MLIPIPDLLDAAQVARVRAIIDAAEWVDGNVTSGPQSALAKRNEQLPEGSAAHREAGAMILDALGRSPVFVAAALPLKVFRRCSTAMARGRISERTSTMRCASSAAPTSASAATCR